MTLAGRYIDGANLPVGGSGRIAETIAATIRAAGGRVLIGAPVVISDAGIETTVNKLLPADVAAATGLAEQCRTGSCPSAGWR